MVLLLVPGWAGPCEEPLDPSDKRLWECFWRRVPLPGKVDLEMSCHSHHCRLTIETRPCQTLGQMESRA